MVTLKLTNAQASLLKSSMVDALDCFENQALIFLYDDIITRIGVALRDEGYKAPEKITKEDLQFYQGV